MKRPIMISVHDVEKAQKYLEKRIEECENACAVLGLGNTFKVIDELYTLLALCDYFLHRQPDEKEKGGQ